MDRRLGPAGPRPAPRARRTRRATPPVGAALVFCPLALVGVLALLAPGGPASAQGLLESEVELEDVLEITLVDRDVVAWSALGTATPALRLEIGEQPTWMRASGRVGVVVTDRRLLAVTTTNGGWQEVRLRVHESRPDAAQIGKRVAIVVTDKRLLGFDGESGNWLSIDIGPLERVRASRVGAQTAVVLTDRSAYGLSPDAGGFFRIPMAIQEKVESVHVGANLATITTSWRVLVFRSPIGVWSVERRNIN